MTAVSAKADVPGDGDWGSRAACLSADAELFFPVSGAGPSVAQIAEAKTVCARCEVRSECLAFALATRQPYGVWGGTSPEERTVLRKKAQTAGLTDAAMVS
jgi:WhiB family transcriptional regulator, redox-sensing transcriptional regulator